MTEFAAPAAPMDADMAHSVAHNLGDASPRSTRWTAFGCLVAVVVAAAAPLGAAESPDDLPGLPPVTRTNQRTFAIPFRLPKSQDPDADATAQRVVLNVSRDLGGTWSAAGEAAPAAGSFTYTADVDGEYWFRLRAVDRKGRSRGGEGPDIRVLVDAAGPRLTARLWKGPDGEIICRYAAADDSLRLDSLVVEYRGKEDRGWKSVAADAVLARESPAHLVGETIWWAGEKVEQLAVRIAIADRSGNQTVKQFSLEPTDPRVDQTVLAKELGVAPLPTQAATEPLPVDELPPAPAATGAAPASPATATTSVLVPGSGAWPAEASTWKATPSAGDAVAANRSPRQASRGPSAAGLLPRADDEPAAKGSARTVSTTDPLAAAGISRPAAEGQPLEYGGRPLHLARSRTFTWDYEIPAVRRTAGPLRAELWTTRDGGLTWQKAATDKDGRSPIDVDLPAAGFYGVRLELVADVPDAAGGPRSGAEADAWIGIDEEPPQVELIGVDRDETSGVDALVIRYAARDPLLGANSVRLLYSPNAEGPWATIAAGAANEQAHRWEPGKNVPARVFIRIEATDAAGNQATAVSDEAVSIAPTRFGGRLGGLRVVPAP